MADLVLSPREFRLLEGLRLMPRRSFAGRVRGERLTQKKGISIEFSDYRDYAEGDDLRHLDWNVLARLGTPIVKTYQDEEDLAVHLLLDRTGSMSFGEPSKAEWALKTACAMGYLALNSGDAVYARVLGSRHAPGPALRGRGAFPRLAKALGQEVEDGRGLSAALRLFLGSSARTGLVVLISDGLDPELPGQLKSLAGKGHEVLMVQVLSPIETDPDLEGDLRLLDAEGGGEREVTANRLTFDVYKANLEAHNRRLMDACTSYGGRYRLLSTSAGMEELVRDVWKREGWVA